MINFGVEFDGWVEISIAEDSDAITRITGPGGDKWRSHFYSDVVTQADVLEHFAYNAIRNGVTDASNLDGWADLKAGEVTMIVKEVIPFCGRQIIKETVKGFE